MLQPGIQRPSQADDLVESHHCQHVISQQTSHWLLNLTTPLSDSEGTKALYGSRGGEEVQGSFSRLIFHDLFLPFDIIVHTVFRTAPLLPSWTRVLDREPCLSPSFTLRAGHSNWASMSEYLMWLWAVKTWAWWEKCSEGWVMQDRFRHNSTRTHPPGGSHYSHSCMNQKLWNENRRHRTQLPSF